MLKFLNRFELFKENYNKERYGEFMRRWERNRADCEACRDFSELLQLLGERLADGETATITTGHYLKIKGPDFEYITRIFKSEGNHETT